MSEDRIKNKACFLHDIELKRIDYFGIRLLKKYYLKKLYILIIYI